ncbi:MAG: hypothetical protein PHI85_01180 [Victivallaceae bacterium]|nr:hypothetical protein [Victivallaceae bacterium]
MIKVAMIGADSSHTVEYARRMCDGSFAPEQRVYGLVPISCMAVPSAFQDAAGIAARCEILRGLGVKRITTGIMPALDGADAVMVEANDPAEHLFYMEQCSGCALPVWLDKPLAATVADGRKILELAARKNIPFFTTSPLRFAADAAAFHRAHPSPRELSLYGALGTARRGSDVVWYGVHTFELLQMMMDGKAAGLSAKKDLNGVKCVVHYIDGRTAKVELRSGRYAYGGTADGDKFEVVAPNAEFYGSTIKEIEKFFQTGVAPVSPEAALEVTAMLEAVDRSIGLDGASVEIGA